MIFLIVAWLFCVGSITAAWTWLRSYSIYEVLNAEESNEMAKNKKYQHRIVKVAMMLCMMALIFLTLHFVFQRTERDVENRIKTATMNGTLESLHSLEHYLGQENADNANNLTAVVDEDVDDIT